MNPAESDPESVIIDLVADTFDVPATGIKGATEPGEISGWDSLGHSVLLTRLARRFHLQMSETLATPVNSVSELVARVRQAVEEPAHG